MKRNQFLIILTSVLVIIVHFIILISSLLFIDLEFHHMSKYGTSITSSDFGFHSFLIISICIYLVSLYLTYTLKTIPTTRAKRSDGRIALLNAGGVTLFGSILFFFLSTSFEGLVILIFIILIISGILTVIVGIKTKKKKPHP